MSSMSTPRIRVWMSVLRVLFLIPDYLNYKEGMHFLRHDENAATRLLEVVVSGPKNATTIRGEFNTLRDGKGLE